MVASATGPLQGRKLLLLVVKDVDDIFLCDAVGIVNLGRQVPLCTRRSTDPQCWSTKDQRLEIVSLPLCLLSFAKLSRQSCRLTV